MNNCEHEWQFANKSQTRCRCKLCGIEGELFRDYRIEKDKQGMPIAMHWRGDFVILGDAGLERCEAGERVGGSRE